jgi:hypothetical protein
MPSDLTWQMAGLGRGCVKTCERGFSAVETCVECPANTSTRTMSLNWTWRARFRFAAFHSLRVFTQARPDRAIAGQHCERLGRSRLVIREGWRKPVEFRRRLPFATVACLAGSPGASILGNRCGLAMDGTLSSGRGERRRQDLHRARSAAEHRQNAAVGDAATIER